MNILILGSGGREHALAWAVSQNPKCKQLYCAPGNAGMMAIAHCVPLDINQSNDVVEFCQNQAIDFVIIGPENPLARGVGDDLRNKGILTFGPSAAAAQLESSKAFTKELCTAKAIPTAAYAEFYEREPALEYIQTQNTPIVIKADGLASGKGVIIAMTKQKACEALHLMFNDAFGDAGARVIIEEFMEGEEASFFILSDGKNILPIGTAQDHKRAFDGDQGPNTGGMGAYSPAPILDEEIQKQAITQIIEPTIAEMARRGTPFQGVLYAGLMIKNKTAQLVEYNARFGDPECQALMMRLGGQALDVMLACAQGTLDQSQINWADDHAITLVYAAKGYPNSYKKNTLIEGLENINDKNSLHVFHAGTTLKDNNIIATGGRVLNITARARTLKQAHSLAYEAIKQIKWDDGFYRHDIGWRAL